MKAMENRERGSAGQHKGAAMKKGWKTEPLGELCDIRNGSTPSKGNPSFWDGGTIPWFTIDDMREQGREISSTRQKITKSALSETSVKLLPEDSVLLCCTASVGEFAITRIPLTTNQQFNGLVVKNRSQLDPNFLFHYASTLKDELLGLSGKTTIDFIPISRLRDVAVPVPPLAEQQRIVGLLDEAFEGLATAKANAEKNIQNARALFESHLQSVFTQRGPGVGGEASRRDVRDVSAVNHRHKRPRPRRAVSRVRSERRHRTLRQVQPRRAATAGDVSRSDLRLSEYLGTKLMDYRQCDGRATERPRA